MSHQKKAILIVLDGFGINKSSFFNPIHASIEKGKMPFYQKLLSTYPHAQLRTHGENVGLPPGVMGNSEVGHMTMGAGRTIDQDLVRISKSIQNGNFFKNPILLETIQKGIKNTGRVHLMGLLSDAGVHSELSHLMALLDLCTQQQVPQVSVHAFLDGRDTPPHSGLKYIRTLLKHPSFSKNASQKTQATLTTLMGRYWAMDRDHRWDRIQKAYLTLTGQTTIPPSLSALRNSDESVEPLLLFKEGAMKDNDSVIFFNFRSDRARQISAALTEKNFPFFDRGHGFLPSQFTGMTLYDKNLKEVKTAFSSEVLNHTFGEWLENHHLSQLRIAETEKYPHVTFFFNGGREIPFPLEKRILIPSPKDISTYDLQPEMSALLVAKEACTQILKQHFDFILINFANADMVGHTGNYPATLKALETLDTCLSQVIQAAQKSGYSTLLTSDHGNIEEMQDSLGEIHTQHTINPVPLLLIDSYNPSFSLRNGSLINIMPTLCELMDLPIPKEVQGESLLVPRNL